MGSLFMLLIRDVNLQRFNLNHEMKNLSFNNTKKQSNFPINITIKLKMNLIITYQVWYQKKQKVVQDDQLVFC